MANARNNEYYKYVVENALHDSGIDFEKFYPLLEQHIKEIIAEHIEADIISIITEIMQYILTLKKIS